jgi:thiol:disulfide interchange protein
LIDKDQVLPANEAFNFKAAINDETILLSWEIKKGYYMYLKSIKIEDNFKELDYEVLESQESIHITMSSLVKVKYLETKY